MTKEDILKLNKEQIKEKFLTIKKNLDCICCPNCSDCSNCSDCYNCSNCYDCYDCMYCLDLKDKQYCILNEQFTKEEYEEFTKNLIK